MSVFHHHRPNAPSEWKARYLRAPFGWRFYVGSSQDWKPLVWEPRQTKVWRGGDGVRRDVRGSIDIICCWCLMWANKQYYKDNSLQQHSVKPKQLMRTWIMDRREYFRQIFSFRENDLKLWTIMNTQTCFIQNNGNDYLPYDNCDGFVYGWGDIHCLCWITCLWCIKQLQFLFFQKYC